MFHVSSHFKIGLLWLEAARHFDCENSQSTVEDRRRPSGCFHAVEICRCPAGAAALPVCLAFTATDALALSLSVADRRRWSMWCRQRHSCIMCAAAAHHIVKHRPFPQPYFHVRMQNNTMHRSRRPHLMDVTHRHCRPPARICVVHACCQCIVGVWQGVPCATEVITATLQCGSRVPRPRRGTETRSFQRCRFRAGHRRGRGDRGGD